MERLNIGIRAEFVDEFCQHLQRQARAARENQTEGRPAHFEVEFEATDNESGDQVMLNINNDDMERDDVKRDEIIVEAD